MRKCRLGIDSQDSNIPGNGVSQSSEFSISYVNNDWKNCVVLHGNDEVTIEDV